MSGTSREAIVFTTCYVMTWGGESGAYSRFNGRGFRCNRCGRGRLRQVDVAAHIYKVSLTRVAEDILSLVGSPLEKGEHGGFLRMQARRRRVLVCHSRSVLHLE